MTLEAIFVIIVFGMFASQQYILGVFKDNKIKRLEAQIASTSEWPDMSFRVEPSLRRVLIIATNSNETHHYTIPLTSLESYFASKLTNDSQQSSIWHVLGMMPNHDKEAIQKAFRKMSMVYHPDHGGSSKAFGTLVAARDKALLQCQGKENLRRR